MPQNFGFKKKNILKRFHKSFFLIPSRQYIIFFPSDTSESCKALYYIIIHSEQLSFRHAVLAASQKRNRTLSCYRTSVLIWSDSVLALMSRAGSSGASILFSKYSHLAKHLSVCLSLHHTYLVLMVGFILRGNSPRSTALLSGLNSRAPEM